MPSLLNWSSDLEKRDYAVLQTYSSFCFYISLWSPPFTVSFTGQVNLIAWQFTSGYAENCAFPFNKPSVWYLFPFGLATVPQLGRSEEKYRAAIVTKPSYLLYKNAYGRLKFVSRCCAIKILMADRNMVASTLCTYVAPELNRMDREQNDNADLLTYKIIKNTYTSSWWRKWKIKVFSSCKQEEHVIFLIGSGLIVSSWRQGFLFHIEIIITTLLLLLFVQTKKSAYYFVMQALVVWRHDKVECH